MPGAGRRTFASGEILTSANVQNYLMDQSVMTFSSAAARTAAVATPSEGMTSYLTDIDEMSIYDGTSWVPVADLGAWITYTPVITASTTNPTVTYTVQTGAYVQFGKTVHFRLNLKLNTVTSAGSGTYRFTLPVIPKEADNQFFPGLYFRNSTSVPYRLAGRGSTGNAYITNVGYTDASGSLGAASPFAPATNDVYTFQGTYEAA